MQNLLVSYEASRPLRSSRTGLWCVSRARTKQSEAAFGYYVPHLRNTLPEYLRSAQTVRSFKSELKTQFFYCSILTNLINQSINHLNQLIFCICFCQLEFNSLIFILLISLYDFDVICFSLPL